MGAAAAGRMIAWHEQTLKPSALDLATEFSPQVFLANGLKDGLASPCAAL